MLQRVMLGLFIALLGLSIWAFTIFFERYDYPINTGYSKEARLNPFLAAEYFLEENEGNVLINEKLDFSFISSGDVVFLSDVDDMVFTQSQIDKALQWVAEGGYLIVGVGDEISGYASLLEYFDIDPIEYAADYSLFDEGADEDESKTASERLRDFNDQLDELEDDDANGLDPFSDLIDSITDEPLRRYTVSLEDGARELTLEVSDRVVLNHPQALVYESENEDYEGDVFENDEYVDDVEFVDEESLENEDGIDVVDYDLTAYAGDDKGSRLLQFDYQQGRLTVLSSSNLWRNDEIGNADNAYLLAYLIPKRSNVYLFYNVESPGLWKLLRDNFFELLIAAGMLLFAWLWRSGLRVQTLKNVTTNQRRLFAEHLTASAKFFVARHQYDVLLKPIDEDIQAQMRLHYPGFSGLDTAKKNSLLLTTTGLSNDVIEQWSKYLNTVDNHEQLMAALTIGNTIRNKL